MKKYGLIFIVALAFVLRFYKLGKTPPSLSWDEVSIGYNAYSILKTGRDEHDKFMPIAAFEAYGDYKPPGYIYATVPFVWMFGLNEFAVRFPSALFGVLTVLATYFLVKELFGFKIQDSRQFGEQAGVRSKEITNYELRITNYALLSAALLAISPWHINLSRAAFEANLALFFIVLGAWFFLKAINRKPGFKKHKSLSFLLASAVFFIFSLYTFNSARIFVPLFGASLAIIYSKRLLRIKKQVAISAVLGLVFLLPLIPHILSPQGQLRFKEVNIFTDLKPIKISNMRQKVHKSGLWARILHNRRVLFGVELARHYFDNLNPNFLFINGDGNPKFSTQDVGELYLFSLPFFIAGLYLLIKDKSGHWKIVPIWLLLGIAPAAIARETPHALRIENSLPMWQILTAYGAVGFLEWFQRLGIKKTSKFLIIILAFSFLVLNFLYYIYNYYYNYPVEFAREWQWGYREAIKTVEPIKNKYDYVYIANNIGRPYMYVLFYTKYFPQKFWKSVDRTSDPFGLFNVHGFGKYKFADNKLSRKKKILYVQPPKDVREGANIIKKILYPDKKVALVIYD